MMSQSDTLTIKPLITDHIEIWTSAILAKSTSGRGSSKKYDLYGITKLRELIFDLAVRGKLVSQNANEESASYLLKNLMAKKTSLINEGKTKSIDFSVDVSNNEQSFELPKGWEWTKLGVISEINGGFAFKSSKYIDEGVRVIRISDFDETGFKNDKVVRYSYSDDLNRFNLEENDILMAMTGGTVGKSLLVKSLLEPMVVNQRVATIKLFEEVIPDFINCLIRTSLIQSVISEAKNSTNDNISLGSINNFLIPLPPLAEQKRIVAKVDELMLLCDDLEQQTEASIDAHATLVEVLLATLTDSADANELAQNWARLSENFDSLFTTEQSIKSLKQTVLQLAVMGKLVPQNPDDEPASVLLERIAEDRSTLTEQGKIKKSKTLPRISEEEKPYNLPSSWEWTRLGSIAVVGTGSTPLRTESKYWESKDVNWVSSGETSKPFIFDTKEKISYLAIKETNVSVYPPGTLVVAMYGQGKTRGQITELKIEAGTNQACAAIKLIQNDKQHRHYLKLFFWKSYEEIRSNAAGGAQPNLNVSKITSTVLPLPPISEQHRIVAKVNELMEICDQLKAKLKQSQTTQVQLTDALVEQALA